MVVVGLRAGRPRADGPLDGVHHPGPRPARRQHERQRHRGQRRDRDPRPARGRQGAAHGQGGRDRGGQGGRRRRSARRRPRTCAARRRWSCRPGRPRQQVAELVVAARSRRAPPRSRPRSADLAELSKLQAERDRIERADRRAGIDGTRLHRLRRRQRLPRPCRSPARSPRRSAGAPTRSGATASLHDGIDFGAACGTPIRARGAAARCSRRTTSPPGATGSSSTTASSAASASRRSPTT